MTRSLFSSLFLFAFHQEFWFMWARWKEIIIHQFYTASWNTCVAAFSTILLKIFPKGFEILIIKNKLHIFFCLFHEVTLKTTFPKIILYYLAEIISSMCLSITNNLNKIYKYEKNFLLRLSFTFSELFAFVHST